MEIDYLCSGKQDSSGLSLMKTDSEPNKKKCNHHIGSRTSTISIMFN